MTAEELTSLIRHVTGCNPRRPASETRGRRRRGRNLIDASCLLALAMDNGKLSKHPAIAAATGYEAAYVHKLLIRGRRRYRECAEFRATAKAVFYQIKP